MKTPQSYLVERLLLDGKETRESLAKKTGLKRDTLNAVIAGACRNLRARARLEAAIGVRIWADGQDWNDRRTVAPYLGGQDPALVNVSHLRNTIRGLRLAWPGLLRKRELIHWFAETVRQFIPVGKTQDNKVQPTTSAER